MNDAPLPSSSYAVASAVDWLLGAFLGPVATAIAVIAVATVGFLALSGRIDVKRATRVILGCFVLFGASTIAAALHLAAGAMVEAPPPRPAYPIVPLPPSPVRPSEPPPAYDPYAGAAVAPR